MGGEENERLKWKLEERKCVCRQVSPFPPTSVSARGTKFNERLLFFFLFSLFEICGNAEPLSRIQVCLPRKIKDFSQTNKPKQILLSAFYGIKSPGSEERRKRKKKGDI